MDCVWTNGMGNSKNDLANDLHEFLSARAGAREVLYGERFSLKGTFLVHFTQSFALFFLTILR